MFLTRSEYDRGVNTFSPEGRLYQIEYALEAIKHGSTAIGIRCRDAVLLAVEKHIKTPLIEPASVEKLYQIDSHVGCAVSGLTPDARTMIEHARVEALSHRFMFDEPMLTETLTQAVCDLALRFGEGAQGQKASMSRPFGVALLVAGFNEPVADADPAEIDADESNASQTQSSSSSSSSPPPPPLQQPTSGAASGPQLYHADPSGTFVEWAAKAIGRGSEGAQDELQREYKKDMELLDAENLVMRILAKVMEEKMTTDNVELASVNQEHGYRTYSASEIKTIMDRIEA